MCLLWLKFISLYSYCYQVPNRIRLADVSVEFLLQLEEFSIELLIQLDDEAFEFCY